MFLGIIKTPAAASADILLIFMVSCGIISVKGMII
uniref:Uncharacterized protein n=1 Tax=Siphoviridae sp. ctwhn18 TaxID=2825733 RepID=A0A8S5NZS6_9CAUD|nr:MAG TPA: hypothetical protein [Siphoviridae sp. ctwhn18]